MPASPSSATRSRGDCANEITEDQFKPLRLMNGLYLQLHAYMLRVAVPYGTLSGAQLRMLAHIARQIRSRLRAISRRGRTSSTTGSSSPKPPTCSPNSRRSRCTRSRPAATASATSAATSSPVPPPTRSPTRAPMPSCCANGRASTPSSASCRASSRSPSSRADTDRAAIQLHDIGLAVGPAGRRRPRLQSLGRRRDGTDANDRPRRPRLHSRVAQYLSYCEAILRVYNRHGSPRQHLQGADQDPRPRARSRRVHAPKSRPNGRCSSPWRSTRRRPSMTGSPRSSPSPTYDAAAASNSVDRSDPDVRRCGSTRTSTPHKQPGYAIATISLKPAGRHPRRRHRRPDGPDRRPRRRAIAFDEIRVTHSQNLVLAHVRKARPVSRCGRRLPPPISRRQTSTW